MRRLGHDGHTDLVVGARSAVALRGKPGRARHSYCAAWPVGNSKVYGCFLERSQAKTRGYRKWRPLGNRADPRPERKEGGQRSAAREAGSGRRKSRTARSETPSDRPRHQERTLLPAGQGAQLKGGLAPKVEGDRCLDVIGDGKTSDTVWAFTPPTSKTTARPGKRRRHPRSNDMSAEPTLIRSNP